MNHDGRPFDGLRVTGHGELVEPWTIDDKQEKAEGRKQ
jgi:hypothetical protein